jgi:alpha-1,2-glucosyltransferase
MHDLPLTNEASRIRLLAVVLGVSYVLAAVFAAAGWRVGDEIVHFQQIEMFRLGDLHVLDAYLTVIPGYHLIVAGVLLLTGTDSLGAARLVNAAFGLLAIGGFLALRRAVNPASARLATAQFVVLPVLAPFFFLVYTDVLSLAMILWATFASIRGRHLASALLLLAALGIRQTNVVWALLLMVMSASRLHGEQPQRQWTEQLRPLLPYGLPIAAFLAFWCWNGSISLSKTQAILHPDFSLHIGNASLALFLVGALFPLHALLAIRDLAAAAAERRALLLVPLIVFVVVCWLFHVDHVYNFADPTLFVRNALLLAADRSPIWRLAYSLLASIGACVLVTTRLRPPFAVWLYPVSLAALSASWLIDQRYALIPLSLWLAFREHRKPMVEWITLEFWLVLAVYCVCVVLDGRMVF